HHQREAKDNADTACYLSYQAHRKDIRRKQKNLKSLRSLRPLKKDVGRLTTKSAESEANARRRQNDAFPILGCGVIKR
ncbi:MAG: hypothetical protein IKA28_06545, partial [Tidjanibacter sp.]|nr:hypothetical protein [Tidjanibacter sp.]